MVVIPYLGAPSVFAPVSSLPNRFNVSHINWSTLNSIFGMDWRKEKFRIFSSFAWFLTFLTGQTFLFIIALNKIWINRMNAECECECDVWILNISIHLPCFTWNIYLWLLFQTIFQFIIRFRGSSGECSVEHPNWNFFQRQKALDRYTNLQFFAMKNKFFKWNRLFFVSRHVHSIAVEDGFQHVFTLIICL